MNLLPSSFRALLVLLGLAGCFSLAAQTLLNLDFGGVAVSARSGPAALGQGTNDFWNAYSHYRPRFLPGMPEQPDGRLEDLRLTDGTPSAVAVAVTNAPGVWGNASGDFMLDSFIFAPDGRPLTVTLAGLAPGRYHFALYGYAAADAAPEQTGVFRLHSGAGDDAVTLGPQTTLGAAGWQAGQPWVEGRQYVLFRDVPVFAGTPVIIEVAPGTGGIAVLNGLQVLARGTAPPRLTVAPPVTGGVTATNLQFHRADYEAVLAGETARFQVTIEAESPGTNELAAPLFEGDLAVLAPRLPPGWRIVNSGRRFTLVAGSPGTHQIECEVVSRVTRADPWQELRFTGPAAAVAALRVTAPAGAEVQWLAGTALPPAAPGTNGLVTLHGALGADQTVALRWQDRAVEVARAALLAAELRSVARLQPTVLRQETTVQLDLRQGRLPALRLTLSAADTPTRLLGDAVRGWRVLPATNADERTLLVEFVRPLDAATELHLTTERPLDALPAAVEITLPGLPEAQRVGGSLALHPADVLARVEDTAGLRQANALGDELARFRFSGPGGRVRVALSRVEPLLHVAGRVHLRVEETRAVLRHDLDLAVSRAGIYQAALAFPTNWSVAEVTAPELEEWRAADGALRLSFSGRLLGERTVTVQLERSLPGGAGEVVVEPLRLAGAARETAVVTAAAAPGHTLKTVALEGLREVPAGTFRPLPTQAATAAVLPASPAQLAFRADTGGWRLALQAERQEARLVAEVFNLLTLGDGVVGGSATIRFAMVNQGVPAFRLRLPAHWRNVEFTGANIRRTDRAGDEWTVTLQDKAWGGYTLVIAYDHSFDPRQAVIDAAGAHPLGVERETGFVAVTAASGLEVAAAAVAEPLRTIDPAELPAADRALITRPVLRAFRYEGTAYALALNVTRHEQVATLAAVADRAQLTSVLTKEGEMLTQAGFLVKNHEQQYQRFRLPAGATLWGVAVNGVPVKADQDGDAVLVALPRDADRDRAFAVDLQYVQQLGGLDGAWPRRLALQAPATDVPGTYAEWELYVPPTRRVAGFGGNMTVARGTTYGFRDAWAEFTGFYARLWHDYALALIFGGGVTVFVVALGLYGRRRGFAGVATVLGVFAVLFILAGMMLPALSKAKGKANRISSVNNLKNIGLAARIFATDNDGRMPADFSQMMGELGTEKILVHPSTGERYTWVGEGKSEEEPQAVLAYGPNVEGRREVLLADGSVQQVTEGRFNELLAEDAKLTAAKDTRQQVQAAPARPAFQMDPALARRYGLAADAATRSLAAAAEAPPPAPTSEELAAYAVGSSAQPAPAVRGLRSLKIEIPKTGRAYQFTRTLNLGGEPPAIRFSVMSTRAFVILRTLLQVAGFVAGLVLVWVQWRRAEPGTLWLALGAGLMLVATASLFIAWRALHLVLIVGVPLLGLLLAAWWASRVWQRRRPAGVTPPALAPTAAVTVLAGALLLGGSPRVEAADAAVPPPVPPPPSLVHLELDGMVRDGVAQFTTTLQFLAAATNQSLALFGPDVALQEFTAESGEAQVWREGGRLGVRLPQPGSVTVRARLLARTAGDVGRQSLDFGLPPALATRLLLTIADPEVEVELPAALTLHRATTNGVTRVEALLGAAERLKLAWTPRRQRGSGPGHVFVEQASLLTLTGGAVTALSRLDYTTPQGELRAVRFTVPPGRRLVRVTGELVRRWDTAPDDDREIVVELTRAVAATRITVETEEPLTRLPADLPLAVVEPRDVTRVSGVIGVRAGDDLGVTLTRTEGLERLESAAVAATLAEAFPGTPAGGLAAAFRHERPGFALAARVEPLQPRIEVAARHEFIVGADQLRADIRLQYAIQRAGVFALQLRLPADFRVESVDCGAMQMWTERPAPEGRVLELALKERTLGALEVAVTLARPWTNLPAALELTGVQPVAAQRLRGFVVVRAEPGVGVKFTGAGGLLEIPAAEAGVAAGTAGALAFKQPVGEPAPWTLRLAAETQAAWLQAEVAAHHTVGETRVTGAARVRYEIQNAPAREFRLLVPAAWRNVEVTAPGLRRRDRLETPAGIEWRLETQQKLQGVFLVDVRWEELRADTNRFTAAGLSVPGVARETGTAAFQARGQLQLVPPPPGDDLLRADARDLPAWAASLAGGTPPALSYRYLRPGWSLPLTVRHLGDAALLEALAERAQLRTVVDEDGQTLTRLELAVRNSGRQHLALTLPPGAELWSAFVDGEPVRPGRAGGRLLLPLEAALGGDEPALVEVIYVGREPFPRGRGRMTLASPKLDVPVKDAHWELFLPPDHRYDRFAGTMNYVSADLAPVAQDFTLATYRRQEVEQASELASRAASFLASASKEVAEGSRDLGLLRSKASRGGRGGSPGGYDTLESTVAQQQRSNLIAAQQDYTLLNSLRYGVTANAPADGPAGTYDDEVAARQVAVLNKVQAVATTRATPLRVNLPTRGLRHLFAQVLQTGTDSALTVTFRVQDQRETGWFRLALLWLGGFTVLWLAAALATFLRPVRTEP